ncbi:PfkB family carbohydrate kinase [Chitinophagaceae bacterium MMS25-I14]
MRLADNRIKKVLCFGELLLRYTPEADGSWIQHKAMPVYIGGAEANVARALALWKVPASYCTAMPDNHLAHQLIHSLETLRVDTTPVLYCEGRVGSFYMPVGTDMKNNAVIYDREHSAFARLKPGMINWDEILQDVHWFHFSAISPALNQQVADMCQEALKAAAAKGITISVDLNYRPALWKYGKEPAEIMPQLVQYCDLIMGNIWAANKMLDIPLIQELIDADTQKSYLEHARRSSTEIIRRFKKSKAVANTFRFTADDGNITYYASLDEETAQYHSKTYTTEKIIDKVGSGDCFMGGLIYGYYNQLGTQGIIDYATAAAYSKLFVQGDFTTLNQEEVKKYIHS